MSKNNNLTEKQEKKRWKDIDNLIFRNSKFTAKRFQPGKETKQFLQSCKVLIIGAGGLGCDLLKNMALSGFKNIHIIDMDTIDISNLNRQFLFRDDDVGESKAKIAAKFVNERVPGVKVIGHNCKIQEKDDDFYKQFNIIISGLDSIKARKWMNNKLCELVEFDDEAQTEVDFSTVIPFIDGGTEGFKGQARVILPKVTSCFACTINLFPPQTTYPLCTIASTPRLPEHCIEYASMIEWKKIKGKKVGDKVIKDETPIDGDNATHIQWLYDVALKRAKRFEIRGVTYRLTQGVIKNIIPAIASTNAIIASVCTNEALKLATLLAPSLDNYMMYNGGEGLYTYTYRTERLSDCTACRKCRPALISCDKDKDTFESLLKLVENNKAFKAHYKGKKIDSPSVSGNGRFYLSYAPTLEKLYRPNLKKKLSELLDDGDELDILNKGWKIPFPIVVDFGEDEDSDDEVDDDEEN